MASRTQEFTTRIFLNDQQAKSEIAALETKIKTIRRDMEDAAKDAKKSGDWTNFNKLKKDLGDTTKQMSAMRTSAQRVDHVLENLSGASVKEIRNTIKAINKELSSGNIERGSDKWNFLNEQLGKCKAELKAIKEESAAFAEQEEKSSLWDKLSKINQIGFAITNLLGISDGLGSLSSSIQQSVEDLAAMDEQMANTRKYTGMTDEAVREMNEDFKNMDTRTSREELNDLAGAAGRLGITSKQAVEEFVDAADKISVALGDDLGDGAVDQVGKLAMAFGEDDRMGLRKAMLATGSAINELAQNSAANAGYLVDFTARVAGVGKQVGLTQAQIMGFASVMDENMLQDEMASTAFSQMMTKMQTDTAKFAKFAGMSIKDFTNLVSTDFNGAILAIADNLKKQDPQTMMKMLTDMGLDGTRAVSVLSNLADKIDDVREKQEIATKAYEDGTSVIGEFNTMNSTTQAQLDKASKKFHELSIELGEQLRPAITAGVNAGTLFVSLLKALFTLLTKGAVTIVSVTVAMTAYTVATNASTAATKLKTFWNDKLVASFQRLWAVVRANPWGVVVAAGAIALGVIIDLARHTGELNRTQKELAKIEDNASEKAIEEKNRLDRLRETVNDNTKSVAERQAAIKEIQEVIPNYIASVNGEGDAYQRNTELLDDYIRKLKEKALVEGAKEEIKDLGHEIAHTQAEIAKQEKLIAQRRKEIAEANQATRPRTSGGSVAPSEVYAQASGSAEISGMERRLRGLRNDAKEATDALGTLTDRFGKAIAESDLAGDAADKSKDKDRSNKSSYQTEADKKKAATEAAKLERERSRQRKEAIKNEIEDVKNATDQLQAENMMRYYRGETDYREYTSRQRQITIDGLENQMAVYRKYNDTSKQLEAEHAKEIFEQQRDETNRNIDDLEKEYASRKLELKGKLYDPSSDMYRNEEAVNEKMFELEIDFLEKKKDLQKEGSEERADTEAEIGEKLEQHKIDMAEKYDNKLRQYREQWGKKSIAEQEDIALRGLEALHDKGLVEEEEYQQMLRAIRLHYAQEQSGQNLQNSKGEALKRNAHSAYETASNNAQADYQNDHPTGTGVMDYFTQDLDIFRSTWANIKDMEADGVVSHQEAMAAMAEATGDLASNIASKMQAAYDAVSPIMDAMSSYYSAQCDLEVTQTEKKYEKLIDRAGNNSAKQKKLEEKKEKEVAAIKTKYNRKQVRMQIAQAIAQNAMSALSAYASVMSGAPWPANLVLAPIAAGIALAAGMIQIATIKKQQQAQEAGYYEGGFTGGSSYRREAGVVHEGEFVANHLAVGNPRLLPALRLIDMAQRNNTVGTLTAEAVSRAMGVGSTTVVSAPQVNVSTDNSELAGTLQEARQAIDRLGSLLESGDIVVKMPDWDDFDRSRRHYDRLQANR